MPIRTLLVDDEYLALQLLEEYIGHVSDLEVVAKAKSGIKALEVLHEMPIDLVFLDIQMPTLSGVNLLKTLQHPPVVIFTTAYSDYAIQAFDLNAVDYLLKPFSFERFLQAVNKAREHIKRTEVPSNIATDHPPSAPQTALPKESLTGGALEFLTARVDGKLVKIALSEILFIEGLKEYVRIVCSNSRFVTLESLKNLEDTLPTDAFIRVHKSYIVARSKVRSLDGNQLEIGTHKIPISRSKRDEIVGMIFFGKG